MPIVNCDIVTNHDPILYCDSGLQLTNDGVMIVFTQSIKEK